MTNFCSHCLQFGRVDGIFWTKFEAKQIKSALRCANLQWTSNLDTVDPQNNVRHIRSPDQYECHCSSKDQNQAPDLHTFRPYSQASNHRFHPASATGYQCIADKNSLDHNMLQGIHSCAHQSVFLHFRIWPQRSAAIVLQLEKYIPRQTALHRFMYSAKRTKLCIIFLGKQTVEESGS